MCSWNNSKFEIIIVNWKVNFVIIIIVSLK